ncbi:MULTISPECIES: alpha/beta fold hydrolase [unclassified Crossiella]|uniref:alpha/beta fold hydrolase n=1 Tax=unclassified Crossiella TaxID=2620835 RepID=UPI0020003E3E|nr:MULTISPECIES: alpha/beta hydrolase [unclassified Crossiella]MCK2237146.1 alpha/beta hydrolase [Crossiella sp. S99.2]MCK2250814.1 alpha/beta hydrolase [Crossiella sp. S99.1]
MTDAPLPYLIRGSGPGLLLAHGAGGGAVSNWTPILDELAEHFTVLAPDYPGSGDNPRATDPLQLDRLADDLVATAVAAGLDEFAIAGYSLGTAVATTAAVRHPDRVRKLALIAGLTHADPWLRQAIRTWLALFGGDPVPLGHFSLLMAAGADALTEGVTDELAATVGSSLAAGVPEQFDLVSRVDIRPLLPRVTAPTLVLATGQDNLTPPHFSRALADGIPDAKLVELPAGHNVFVEAKPELLAALLEFLPTQ